MEKTLQEIERLQQLFKDNGELLYAITNQGDLFCMVNKKLVKDNVFHRVEAYSLEESGGKYNPVSIGYLSYGRSELSQTNVGFSHIEENEKNTNSENGKAILHMVSTNRNFLGTGVGSYMLRYFEQKAYEGMSAEGELCIGGNYSPQWKRGDGVSLADGIKQVDKFYNINGYEIIHNNKGGFIAKTVTHEDYEQNKENIYSVGGVQMYGPLKNFMKYNHETEEEMER